MVANSIGTPYPRPASRRAATTPATRPIVAEQQGGGNDCTFLYFKPSGKWKYEGRGRFPRPQTDGWHDVNREEIIRENGGMPGISSLGEDYVVIVIPDEACDVRSAYPRMLKSQVEL